MFNLFKRPKPKPTRFKLLAPSNASDARIGEYVCVGIFPTRECAEKEQQNGWLIRELRAPELRSPDHKIVGATVVGYTYSLNLKNEAIVQAVQLSNGVWLSSSEWLNLGFDPPDNEADNEYYTQTEL